MEKNPTDFNTEMGKSLRLHESTVLAYEHNSRKYN